MMLRIIGSVTYQMRTYQRLMSWMTVQSPITDCAQEMVKKMVGRCDLGPVSEADGSPGWRVADRASGSIRSRR